MSSVDENRRTLIINIISIVISALIIRCIYTIFDCAKLLIDETIDGDEDDYQETYSAVFRTILIVFVCVFAIIIIYESVRYKYIN